MADKWTFRLTLQYKKTADKGWNVDGYDELIATNLIQLLSQLLILITSVQRRIHEDEILELRMQNDDEIPF